MACALRNSRRDACPNLRYSGQNVLDNVNGLVSSPCVTEVSRHLNIVGPEGIFLLVKCRISEGLHALRGDLMVPVKGIKPLNNEGCA